MTDIIAEDWPGNLDNFSLSTNFDNEFNYLPGKNGLDCTLANHQDSNYSFLEEYFDFAIAQDEDSKSRKMPVSSEDVDCSEGCPTQNVCHEWMNSSSQWLDNQLSNNLNETISEIVTESDQTDVLEFQDSLDDLVDKNASTDRFECHSIGSDDNDSDDYSITDDQSSLSSANKSDLNGNLSDRVGTDHDFSDDVLCRIKTRDLNIQISGLSEERKGEIKSRRRTLKNRGYARNSRSKRTKQTSDLQARIKELKNEVAKLRSENKTVAQERDDLKRIVQHLNKK